MSAKLQTFFSFPAARETTNIEIQFLLTRLLFLLLSFVSVVVFRVALPLLLVMMVVMMMLLLLLLQF